MLIRVDPRTKVLSLLSLPRDLLVQIDGYGTRKINDAYAYGGAPLAIKTVSRVLGVKINYYVPVNFHLFRKTVDTFPVYLDIDRRYLHVNNGYGDYAEINLKPGYQKVSGLAALEYVRERHDDSDFMRTARQQAFVREFKRRLDPWSAGTNLFGLLDSLPNDLKVRGSAKGQSVGPRTILRYVKLLSQIKRGNMVQVRIVGETGMVNGASVVQASPAAIQAAVNEFQNPNPAVAQAVASRFGGTLLGGAKKTVKKTRGPKPIPPAKLRVVTVNGSGVQGVATVAKVALQKAGWPHTGVAGNLPEQNLFSTAVYYTSARARLSAERLRRSLGDTNAAARLPAALSDFGLGADVVVALGTTFTGVTPPPAQQAKLDAPPPSRPLVQPAAPNDPGDFFLLQKRTGYQLLYPSKVPAQFHLRRGDRERRERLPHLQARQARQVPLRRRAHGLRLLARLGPALHALDGRSDPRPAEPAGLLGQAPGTRLHERPRHPPHRGLLRRRAVQGLRRSRRLDQQLAGRQAVARDDDRDREEPQACGPGTGLIDTGRRA